MKPQLCKLATMEDVRKLPHHVYLIEEKYDGVRAFIKDGKLYNRRGDEITHKFPEFYGLEAIKGTWDGEIIATTGEFNDISGRVHLKDKLQIKILARKHPARFVCWDVCHDGVNDCKHMALIDRKQLLENADFRILMTWFEVAPTQILKPETLQAAWDAILEQGKEGLVIKHHTARYHEGSRNATWLKLKAWEEVVAEFSKYEEHPKGITIETDDGRRVVVNGYQAEDVKEAFEQYGKIKAEIQHLPQKDSDAWRFPSFRGLVG